MWLVLGFVGLKYINQDYLKPQLRLRVHLHLLWTSKNGWELINFILTGKYAWLSVWEIKINILLATNFSKKLLSSNLNPLEHVSFLSWRAYLYHLAFLCPYFVTFSSCGVFFHCQNCISGKCANLLPAGRLALELPHGRATTTWSLIKFSVYLVWFRQMKCPEQRYHEQDALVPYRAAHAPSAVSSDHCRASRDRWGLHCIAAKSVLLCSCQH